MTFEEYLSSIGINNPKTQNVPNLRIHKLTQEQYNNALEAGFIEDNAIYLTPDNSGNAEEMEFISTDDIDAICGSTTLEDGVRLTFNNHSVTDDGNGNITISEGV